MPIVTSSPGLGKVVKRNAHDASACLASPHIPTRGLPFSVLQISYGAAGLSLKMEPMRHVSKISESR